MDDNNPAQMKNLKDFWKTADRVNEADEAHKQSQLVALVRQAVCKSARDMITALESGEPSRVNFALTELGALLRCEETETAKFHDLLMERSRMHETHGKERKSDN